MNGKQKYLNSSYSNIRIYIFFCKVMVILDVHSSKIKELYFKFACGTNVFFSTDEHWISIWIISWLGYYYLKYRNGTNLTG